MPKGEHPKDLEGVLDEVSGAAEDSAAASIGDILETVGRRSFGPFLVVLALVAFTPLGGIPGLPTVLAAMVILIAGQLLLGMEGFWLPGVVRRRSIEAGELKTTLSYLQPVARMVDKAIRPRLAWLTQGPFVRVLAFVCILVALTIPPLEVVPFGGTVSWAAIAAFGLALIAHDGLLALVAFGFSAGAAYAVYTMLL